MILLFLFDSTDSKAIESAVSPMLAPFFFKVIPSKLSILDQNIKVFRNIRRIIVLIRVMSTYISLLFYEGNVTQHELRNTSVPSVFYCILAHTIISIMLIHLNLQARLALFLTYHSIECSKGRTMSSNSYILSAQVLLF